MAKKFWTEERSKYLRKHYPKADLDYIAARLGVSKMAVKCRAQVMGLKRKVNKKRPWTQRQINLLRKHYADAPMALLIEKTQHGRDCIWKKAQDLGLHKSREFLAELGHRVSQTEASHRHRFPKGHVPNNKGKRIEEFMSPEGIERSSRTRFQKGHIPHNTHAVGTEVLHGDGYMYVKVEGSDRMVLKQRHVWEQANGPIPEGYNIQFRDGNPLNCDIANLELMSREDAARRTIKNETPEARRERVRKALATRTKTIQRDRLRIQYGLRPKTRLVKYGY